MNRRVPEFALVTGAFLSGSFCVAGLVLTGDVVRTLLTSVVILYPFSAYAVTHSPDPTGVLPPRVTSTLAVVVGTVLGGAVVVRAPVASELPYALFLALLVVLPPAAYHVRYGDRDDRLNPLSPPLTFLVTGVVAALVLGYGLLVGGAVFAAASALLVALGGALYVRASGERLRSRTRRRLVAGGALAGVCVVGVGVLRGAALDNWVLVGLVLVVAPTLYYALTAEER